jgi:pentafunctional AROM polypeptide
MSSRRHHPKQFYIFGFPIAKSKSPILHNTAFAYHNLPHQYSYVEIETLDETVRGRLRAKDFGGASVTQPHKLNIRKFVDEVTPIADLLGAINTVIPVKGKDGRVKLVGDNTD